MAKPRSIVESPEAALAELTAHTRPTWLARSTSLPFGELYGDEFEVFCYLLVSAERPGRRVIYYGKTADGGRDIIAETEDGRIELVQCKRYTDGVDASVVRKDLAKVFTNLHLGIIPEQPDRVVFYVAPGLTAGANDLLMQQSKWLAVCEEALKAGWKERKLAKDHGLFPQALLDFARTWWPETDVVPGVKLTERAERNPRLIEKFFAAQKVVDNSAVEALRDRLLPQNLDRLWNYDEQALGKADALFDEDKYAEAAGLLEALIEELGEDTAVESRIRRTRARLNLAACWLNLRDHDKAEAAIKRVRSDDLDRADRATQLRYARIRLLLDSKADVSRWLDGDDARSLRQTKAILEGSLPEEPIEHPDVLLLAAGTALFDGRLNDVVRFATRALEVTEGKRLLRAQSVHFLALALHQTMVEGGADLVPIEERGPLLGRIERELEKFAEPLHPPTDRVVAQAQAIYARMALVSPMQVPLAEEGGKALPTAEWFSRLIEAFQSGSTLADLEALAQAYPGRALIEAPLSEALVNAGRVGEGIRHAHEAVRLLPCHRHHFLLAGALVRAGRIKEAWHFAQRLPFEREPAFVGIVARLLVAVVPGSPPLDERQETLERLRACSPHDPFLRLAEGFMLGNHGHLSKGADAVWQGVQSLWAEGAELEVSLLKEVKKLQGFAAEQRHVRWKALAEHLKTRRADPVAESLYLELFYDLEQPADLPPADFVRLAAAGYVRYGQVDDVLTLMKLARDVRTLWSRGDLPAELPDQMGLPSAFRLVDKVAQGQWIWPAPVELLPLENPELLAAVQPDVPPPEGILVGLFELYLLAEVDGLDALLQGTLEVAIFRDCIGQLLRDEPQAAVRDALEDTRRGRLEARRRLEEGQVWRRFVWPAAGDADEAAWARDHEALLIRRADESEGATPEDLIATLLDAQRVRASEVSQVEAWQSEAGGGSPLPSLERPRIALAADVVTHRVVDLLDVLLDVFQQVLLTPRAAQELESLAQAGELRRRAHARWARARDALEQLDQGHRLQRIPRPEQAVAEVLPQGLNDIQRTLLGRALCWYQALVDRPNWRLLSADRFTHGLFTIFSETAVLRLLGVQYDMSRPQARYSGVRGRVTTLSGHLAQNVAPLEVLRRLARLGALGLAGFPVPMDDILVEPDEVALQAMEASARAGGDRSAAWLINHYADATLRIWEAGPEVGRPVLARVILRAVALDMLEALLVELMSAALMTPGPAQITFAEAVAEEALHHQPDGAALRAAFSLALVALEPRDYEPSFVRGRNHAIKLGVAIEQFLTFGRPPDGRTFRSIAETLAILSGHWPDKLLESLLLGSDQGGQQDAETVLRRAAHSNRLQVFRPWVMEARGSEAPGREYRVALAPGALLLRMERPRAIEVARFLAGRATDDSRLRKALLAFAEQPEDPGTRRALAIAEASSPVRLFAHHPAGFAQWGRMVVSAIGFMTRLADFRTLLAEEVWADEESGDAHLERLIGPSGTWATREDRGELILRLGELPSMVGLRVAQRRLAGLPPEAIFRDSQERLGQAPHLGAGQVALALMEGWLGALEHPEVQVDGSPIQTRERFTWALERVLRTLVDVAPAETQSEPVVEASTERGLIDAELDLLRLCRKIIGRTIEAPFTPWYECLWLSWRLHVWLLHQLADLEPTQRAQTIEVLAAAGRTARLDRWRCHFDPVAFGTSRELRAVHILGALAMATAAVRQAHEGIPFSPLSEGSVEVLVTLASPGPSATSPGEASFFPLFPWPNPTRVPELALLLIASLDTKAWPKMPPAARLRWLDRLTSPEGVPGLIPVTGWYLFGTFADQSTPDEVRLMYERSSASRLGKVEMFALLAALKEDSALAVPADLDERILMAMDDKVQQHFLALRLEIALARAPETFETIARSYFAQAPDPIPLAQGLSLLVTRPEPAVAEAARALVAALSKEAPFCNDPRMQTLFDLTGVT